MVGRVFEYHGFSKTIRKTWFDRSYTRGWATRHLYIPFPNVQREEFSHDLFIGFGMSLSFSPPFVIFILAARLAMTRKLDGPFFWFIFFYLTLHEGLLLWAFLLRIWGHNEGRKLMA